MEEEGTYAKAPRQERPWHVERTELRPTCLEQGEGGRELYEHTLGEAGLGQTVSGLQTVLKLSGFFLSHKKPMKD